MKKFLTVFLCVCLIATMTTMLAVGSFAKEAEDIEITVGQTFEWNETEKEREWTSSKGVSPDGLWKYQFYALEKGIYSNLSSLYAGGFAWNSEPADDGVGYARVREKGINFHPGKTADVVKTFICPSGGTIAVNAVVTRRNPVAEGMTGTSFAVYLDDTLVYPTDGTQYVILNSTAPLTVDFEVEVAKNQHLYFRIGAVEGNISSDSTDMTNSVTYKSINDNVSDEVVGGTLSLERISNDISIPAIGDGNTASAAGASNGGSNVGLIIGIVVGVVAVVAVVAVVVVMKKKKQD